MDHSKKVTIITAVLNNRETIESCIQSVISQTYPNIEYIIIDGGSTDGTADIIKRYNNRIAHWMSQVDTGMYDAINKGFEFATGEIIGILNADDFYSDNSVIETVVNVMTNNSSESCYGDLSYVDKYNADRIIRHWKSGNFSIKKFIIGWMPPHPTFFVKKQVYEKYGYFNTDLKIAADYEIMLRFLYKYRVSTSYIPKFLVKMRMGGMSNRSLNNIFRKAVEDHKAWKINNLKKHPLTVILKNLLKIKQFFVMSYGIILCMV